MGLYFVFCIGMFFVRPLMYFVKSANTATTSVTFSFIRFNFIMT